MYYKLKVQYGVTAYFSQRKDTMYTSSDLLQTERTIRMTAYLSQKDARVHQNMKSVLEATVMVWIKKLK